MPRKTTKKTVKVTKATKKPAKKVAAKPPVVPAAPPPQAPRPVLTEADRIWSEIRFRPIEMFGLPGQVVEQHVTPFPADPNKLFLTTRSTAVLPSLEMSLGKDFVVELADRFLIVTRPTNVVVPPKK